jgi:uncharacterized protein (TIGR02231 family)
MEYSKETFDMKKIAVLLGLGFVYFTCMNFVITAQDKVHGVVVSPQIKSATVFLSGAEINSTVKVNLHAGSNEVIFENLSPYLIANSIQVKAANSSITIVSVNSEKNYMSDLTFSGRLKSVNDSIQDISLKLSMRQSYLRVYNDERDMVLANKKIGGNQTLVVDDVEEMADFFRKRLVDIEMKMIDVNLQIADLQKLMTRLQAQERVLKAGSVKNTTDVIVNVSSPSKQSVDFELSYVVQQAGWVPKYDLRAVDIDKPITMNFKADVYNATGFDWNNIAITLSTGNPAIDNTQPHLSPWYIQQYTPVKYYSAKDKNPSPAYGGAPARQDNEKSLEQVVVTKSEISKAKTVADFTQAVESSVSNEFVILMPYTIKSDSKPYVVDIQKHDLPVVFNYMSVPKVDVDAFLLARVSGWESLKLLPGEANVYFEGTFVGTSFIETNSTEDTLNISIGRDKNITIQREKIDEFCKNTVIGGNKRSTRGYEITIKNMKSKPITIEIKDQVPLSSFKEVVVEMQESKGATYNDKTGELKWVVTLQPGESKSVSFKFQVRYPKDMVFTNF